MAFTVKKEVGRLVLAELMAPLTANDVAGVVQGLRMTLIAAPAKMVLCGDLTRLTVIAPEHADVFTGMFTKDNAKVERSAFLVDKTRGAFVLQLERMVREAGNPNRRVFDDVQGLTGFLEPVLDAKERAELTGWLARTRDEARGPRLSGKR